MATRIDARYIAESIGNSKPSGSGFMVRCPAHDDNKPSLYLADGRDGSIVVKCHAGCDFKRVVDVLKSRDLWPKRSNSSKGSGTGAAQQAELLPVAPVPTNAPELDFNKVLGWEPTSKFRYLNAEGQLMFIVARHDHMGTKDIRPVTLTRYKSTGRLEWKARGLPRPRPLYGLNDLAQRPEAPVILVEGEKTANAAARLFPDHVAITWAGGAKGIEYADFSPLNGRNVTLWPDNDEPGKQAMASLASVLKAQGVKTAKQVTLPAELPSKWDLADPIPDGTDIASLLKSAEEKQTGLRVHVLSASALAKLPITPREYIIDPFLPTASMSMVFAERGVGKTWFALSMCVAISRRNDFLGFPVPKDRKVLYIDGEMALYDLKSRVIALDEGENDNLFLLPSERLFRLDRPLNINEPDDQARIVEVIEQLGREGNLPELVVFDNLSSLSAGTDENDNSALDKLLQWLVSLRHRQLAIMLVHHAGKSGDQRGASRREDLLDTSIKLTRPKPKKGKRGGDDEDDEPEEDHDGAFFEVEFVKTRGRRPSPYQFKIKLEENPEGSGKVSWDIDTAMSATAADKVLRYIALHKPHSQKSIAESMNLTPGRVSQICTELRSARLISTERLEITDAGHQRVIELWPKLREKLIEQKEIPI